MQKSGSSGRSPEGEDVCEGEDLGPCPTSPAHRGHAEEEPLAQEAEQGGGKPAESAPGCREWAVVPNTPERWSKEFWKPEEVGLKGV